MGLLDPRLSGVDVAEFARLPYAERIRTSCRTWIMDGFGTPWPIFVVYVVKMGLYVGGFLAWAAATPDLGGPSTIAEWWATPLALQKAALWSLLFEALGLGCGFGPLTGHYFPPLATVDFWRPGTIRAAHQRSRERAAVRTWGDVGLYVGGLALTVRALAAPTPGAGEVLPIVVLVLALGLRDRASFLAHRPEHYLLATFVIAFPGDTLPAYKLIALAIWWGAATSKLNHHFPSVVAAMLANAPLLRIPRLQRALVKDFPDDLRASRIPTWLAHGGTVIEYLVPLALVLSTGGPVTVVGCAIMLLFHFTILSSFPLGVPLEWNVFFLYSLVALFGVHAEVRPWEVSSPVLAVVLLVVLVVVPVVGNLRPDRVSFLTSMRYYAGNWTTTRWYVRKGLVDRFDERLTKITPSPMKQLGTVYDEPTSFFLAHKGLAFRSMHLHGRLHHLLLDQAVDDVEDYDVLEGEFIAGMVVGWNFGEGRLHDDGVLASVQALCDFSPGDVRVVVIEPQPIHRQHNAWRIVDAADGVVASGVTPVDDYRHLPPWPTVD